MFEHTGNMLFIQNKTEQNTTMLFALAVGDGVVAADYIAFAVVVADHVPLLLLSLLLLLLPLLLWVIGDVAAVVVAVISLMILLD